MKTIVHSFLFVALTAGLCAAPSVDILPPQKRTASLDLVRSLLTTKPIDISADTLAKNNPFNPVKPSVDSEAVAKGPTAPASALSERDLLQTLAATVTPSGTMQLGDQLILLFGQKKLKVGDHIPIVFQGSTYELQISAIERTSFSLRINNAEITRPIKPVVVTKP